MGTIGPSPCHLRGEAWSSREAQLSCLLDGVPVEMGLDRKGEVRANSPQSHSCHLFSSYHVQAPCSTFRTPFNPHCIRWHCYPHFQMKKLRLREGPRVVLGGG